MPSNTKRYVDHYLQVYASVFRDALYAYPAMSVELGRDAERLNRLATERGLHLFMVDLPALGKHLDRCLTEGAYKLSGLPASRRFSNRGPIPKLFRGLLLRVFCENGLLKEDFDAEALLFLRQFYFMAKKATVPCSDQATAEEIRNFLDTDGSLPEPHPWWAAESLSEEAPFPGFAAEGMPTMQVSGGLPDRQGDPTPSDQSLLARLDTIVALVSTTLGPFIPEEWRFKHGPGVVSDVPSGENRYRFLNWPARLENVFPSADYAFYGYSSWADETLNRRWLNEEPHSRLIAVPKTLTKPRLIAAEPSAHMWCQQNIWCYFRTQVRKTWLGLFVKFTDQTQNQELCLRGSVDGSLATLDLSEASDRVSTWTVGNAFRANPSLLRALRSTRTRLCLVSLNGEDKVVELRKYSTMGNATTFPVESLVFLACSLAACLEEADFMKGGRNGSPGLLDAVRRLQGKVSIFGDDIIVPSEKAGIVERLLTLIGFKVNRAKSFTEGNFRESCGVDAFRGIEVTPVYVSSLFDGSPESYASCIDTANNLYTKRWLVCTSETIRRQLRGKIRFPMVPCGSGLTGFQSFVSPSPSALSTRWNKDLQEEEYRVPTFNGKVSTTPFSDDTALLQFFTEEPDPYQNWKGGLRSRPVLRIKHRWVSSTQFPAKGS